MRGMGYEGVDCTDIEGMSFLQTLNQPLSFQLIGFVFTVSHLPFRVDEISKSLPSETMRWFFTPVTESCHFHESSAVFGPSHSANLQLSASWTCFCGLHLSQNQMHKFQKKKNHSRIGCYTKVPVTKFCAPYMFRAAHRTV